MLKVNPSRLWILCVLLTGLLFSSLAQAQTYKRYKLPVGQRFEIAGEKYQGFNFLEYQKLLRMDADLKAADNTIPELYSKIKLLEKESLHLSNTIELDKKSLSLCESEVSRKDVLVTDLSFKNVKLNEELTKRKRVFRITLGVGVALVGGLILGLFLGQ